MSHSDGLRVALYARVSTPDQDPEPQLTQLRAWAKREGHTVTMERAEIASGKLVRRSLQDEIMGEALGRRVDAVACTKVDRWARSLRFLSDSLGGLHERGAAFYCVDQGLRVVKGDPTSKLTLDVLGAVAEWEGSIISERTKDALRARKAAGVVLGRPWWKVKGIPPATGETGEIPGGLVNDRLTGGSVTSRPPSDVASPVGKVSP